MHLSSRMQNQGVASSDPLASSKARLPTPSKRRHQHNHQHSLQSHRAHQSHRPSSTERALRSCARAMHLLQEQDPRKAVASGQVLCQMPTLHPRKCPQAAHARVPSLLGQRPASSSLCQPPTLSARARALGYSLRRLPPLLRLDRHQGQYRRSPHLCTSQIAPLPAVMLAKYSTSRSHPA